MQNIGRKSLDHNNTKIFYLIAEIAFRKKKDFSPSKIFEPLIGDSFLIQKYNEKYKQMYIHSWVEIQNKFEACLRRNNPLRDNIVDCWANEIVVIDFLKDELFYSERWKKYLKLNMRNY